MAITIKSLKLGLLISLITLSEMMVLSCKHSDKNEDAMDAAKTKTPVTTVSVSKENITENITLNATSSYQKKSILKSSTYGYVKSLDVSIGQQVKAGQTLFTIQTKEASVYHNTKIKDSTLQFAGMIKVNATCDGIISGITHFVGEYVQDGDQLCIISELNSLIFLLEVPYEMNKFIHLHNGCTITLPDGNELKAVIDSRMPEMDSGSQMESFKVKVSSNNSIPENLLATISIIKSTKKNAFVMPKESILSNETQTEFWVMKLINDSTAVKTKITTGIHNKDKIEILNPEFSLSDRILASGNYGLSDTAIVIVQK